MANENNTQTALQEPDADIERRLEIESLFGEVEAARSEISALNWCIQRMEYALRSRNVRGEIRSWSLKPVTGWTTATRPSQS